ncbi:MAG: hypothetical protein PVF28_01425, partial [Thioalkalispiraceae bacterium]
MIHTHLFPWRNRNDFQLLIDSEQFFPEMLQAINQANSFIFLEQYLIKSGEVFSKFITEFLHAAQRGVNIYILFDDYGSKEVSARDIERLKTKNI